MGRRTSAAFTGGSIMRTLSLFTLVFLLSGTVAAQVRAPDLIPPSWPASGSGANFQFGVQAVPEFTAAALATTDDVRDALDLVAADVVLMSFGTSDLSGIEVFNTAVTDFPVMGSDYLVMSTGNTSSVLLPNDAPDTSTVLGGLNNSQGQDLVQIVMVLKPPSTSASCLAFDFAYYSEEFPEFVGSQFNDAFIAEIGQSTYQIVNDQVVAPNNFAFDTNLNVVSINTVFGVTAGSADGTTFDGGTPLLTAKTPLENPGDQITITFSIMDLGDSIYDSAVLIDNMRWLYGVACEAGADVDTDRDALLDGWETDGIDFDNDGNVDLDLPAMGADPRFKDIFVEIDYMVLPDEAGVTGHTHEPSASALQIMIDAFKNAPVSNPDKEDGTPNDDGIRVHIDAGSGTIMNPVTNATWGTRSKSDVLSHQDNLGTCTGSTYNWTAFDGIKGLRENPGKFDVQRGDVFHYVIFGHSLCPEKTTTSGISRGIPGSDALVTLGGWDGDVGSVNQQAGTLMHELGHNFALKHGGDDHANYEPNYLSVMNYSFQTKGLRISGSDGTFDYSRFDFDVLDEDGNLDETTGITPAVADYGTRFYDKTGTERIVDQIDAPIDWEDGTGAADNTNAKVDINISGGFGMLDDSNNWAEFKFNGGAIGAFGEEIILPVEIFEPGLFDITELEDRQISADFAVAVMGPAVRYLAPGKSAVYDYEVKNTGTKVDGVTVGAAANPVWSDLSGLPTSLPLVSGGSEVLGIMTTVPSGASAGMQSALTVSAHSESNPAMMDEAKTITIVSIAAIDIKPGSRKNSVRLRNTKNGVIPVAILGSETFDIADIDFATLAFGPAGVATAHDPAGHVLEEEPEDVNLDGYVDLVIHFGVMQTGLAPGDTQACLTGKTLDGTPFGDCDSVNVR